MSPIRTRYVFITGGVGSSLGKGPASAAPGAPPHARGCAPRRRDPSRGRGLGWAALGALLQARGYRVRLRKLDPYLNVDPGTMSPTQHGEVFVTDDGAETDLDLGHSDRKSVA